MAFEIVLCDDNPRAVKLFQPKIKTAFGNYTENLRFTIFEDPRRLLAYILNGNMPDILFLDIDMPEVNGIALCRQLKEKGYEPQVVFLSDMEHRVFDTFEFNPVYFLRKRRFDEEIEKVAKKVFQDIRRNQEAVLFSDGTRSYRILIRDIKYIEIINQTLSIYKKDERISLRYKMRDAEKLLLPYGFLRVHKGYLVNYRYINCIQRETVLLTDGQSIPMSRRRYQEIKQQFLKLVTDELRNGNGNSI